MYHKVKKRMYGLLKRKKGIKVKWINLSLYILRRSSYYKTNISTQYKKF